MAQTAPPQPGFLKRLLKRLLGQLQTDSSARVTKKATVIVPPQENKKNWKPPIRFENKPQTDSQSQKSESTPDTNQSAVTRDIASKEAQELKALRTQATKPDTPPNVSPVQSDSIEPNLPAPVRHKTVPDEEKLKQLLFRPRPQTRTVLPKEATQTEQKLAEKLDWLINERQQELKAAPKPKTIPKPKVTPKTAVVSSNQTIQKKAPKKTLAIQKKKKRMAAKKKWKGPEQTKHAPKKIRLIQKKKKQPRVPHAQKLQRPPKIIPVVLSPETVEEPEEPVPEQQTVSVSVHVKKTQTKKKALHSLMATVQKARDRTLKKTQQKEKHAKQPQVSKSHSKKMQSKKNIQVRQTVKEQQSNGSSEPTFFSELETTAAPPRQKKEEAQTPQDTATPIRIPQTDFKQSPPSQQPASFSVPPVQAVSTESKPDSSYSESEPISKRDIENLKNMVEKRLVGQVDSERLEKLITGIETLLEKNMVTRQQIEENVNKIDPRQVLDGFTRLLSLIEPKFTEENLGSVRQEIDTTSGPQEKPSKLTGTEKELEKKELITDFDKIIEIVRERGSITNDQLAAELKIDKKVLKESLDILEENSLVIVEYPAFGPSRVVDPNAQKKKKNETVKS